MLYSDSNPVWVNIPPPPNFTRSPCLLLAIRMIMLEISNAPDLTFTAINMTDSPSKAHNRDCYTAIPNHIHYILICQHSVPEEERSCLERV